MAKKLKTHKSSVKRFKVTVKDKVIGQHGGHAHFNQKKSAARKRNSAIRLLIGGKIGKNIKRALGV